jgi:hypothetical protein
MKTATVRLPASAGLETILRFARDIEDFYLHDEITFDFGEATFMSPFSMLFLAATLKIFRSRSQTRTIRLVNYEDHTYAAHMGFFKLFGADYGRDVGQSAGSVNYRTITCLRRGDFYEKPTDKYALVFFT